MTETTPRFGLPFILPGQAQKEFFHNEALAAADSLLHPSIEDGPLEAPPADPEPGESWVIGTSAQGAWSGRECQLATWTAGGWRFFAPSPGMTVWKTSAALPLQWTGTAWTEGELRASKILIGGQQVVGARLPPIASPSGGTIIDAEARSAIGAVIVALRSHGLID